MVWSISKGVLTTQKRRAKVTAAVAAFLLILSSVASALAPFVNNAAAAAVSGDVWITAAMPSPATSGSEYVTLENKTSNPIDLNGWIINAGADRLITAAGTLAGGASATICPVGVTTAPCTAGYSTPTTSLSLNNDGDTIDLFDESSNSIDQVTYTEAEVNVGVETSFSHSTATGPVLNTDSGIDYPDIQSAIAAATTGDTLSVAAGNYNGTINVNKALTINGASGAILDGTFIVSADDVKVDGFTINDSFAAAVTFASNTTFSNNQINYLPGATTGIGANSNPGTNLNFINNSFGNGGSGADADITIIGQAGVTGNVTISGNTSTSDTSLIALFKVNGATISGNTKQATGASAIYIGGGNSNVDITGNIVTGATTALNIANINGGPNSSVTAHTNQFDGSNTAGLNVQAGAYNGGPLDATNNWWGDASGPTISSNPSGSGSTVTSNATFSPWCTNPSCTTFASTPPPDTSSTTFVGSPKYVRQNNSGDLTAQVVTPDETQDVRFYVDGNTSNPIAGTNIGGAGATTSWWRLRTALPAGQHTISVEVKVNNAWYAVADTGIAYSLDRPTVEYIIPGTNQFFRTNDLVARLKIDDEFNQFDHLVTTIGSSNYTLNRADCTDEGAFVQCDLKNLNLPDGTFTASTTTYTKANNRADNVLSQAFTIDNTKPDLTNFQITDTRAVYGTTVALSADATDVNGIDNVTFYVTAPRLSDGACDGNGAHLASAVGSLASGSTYAANLGTSGLNGDYCVNAIAGDVAANHSSILHIKVTLDNTAPVVSITNPTAGSVLSAVHSGIVDVRGSVSDTNPDHYYFKISGPNYNYSKTVNRTTSFSNETLYSWNLAGLASGDYTIDLEARDQAGNKDAGSTQKIHVTVDNTAPGAPTDSAIYKGHNSNSVNKLSCPGYINSNLIRVTWSASTDNDVAYYWFGTKSDAHHAKVYPSQTDANGNLYYNGSMTPGHNPYYYTVTAVDQAGNESSIPAQTCNVTLDQADPTVTLNNVVTTISGTQIFSGTVSDSDPSSGLKNGEITLAFRPIVNNLVQAPVKVYHVSVTNGTWSVDVDTAQFTDSQQYRVVARANDNAGNTNAATADTTVDNSTTTGGGNNGGGQNGGGSGNGSSSGSSGTSSKSANSPASSTSTATVGGFGGGGNGSGGLAVGVSGANSSGTSQPAVLGAQTDKKDKTQNKPGGSSSDASVLGSSISKGDSGCSKLLGICWYYWAPIVIGGAVVIYYILRRRGDQVEA